MKKTIFDTAIIMIPLHWLFSGMLKILGWRREGRLPDFKKFILIGAPHTSNWDLPFVLAYAFSYRMKVFWMGKDALFRYKPLGRFFRWLGGIPIDRMRSQNAVQRAIEIFKGFEQVVMVISPEGTRKKVRGWRTGFITSPEGLTYPSSWDFSIIDGRRAGSALSCSRRGTSPRTWKRFEPSMQRSRRNDRNWRAPLSSRRHKIASPAIYTISAQESFLCGGASDSKRVLPESSPRRSVPRP